jgi:hypothetical protein
MGPGISFDNVLDVLIVLHPMKWRLQDQDFPYEQTNSVNIHRNGRRSSHEDFWCEVYPSGHVCFLVKKKKGRFSTFLSTAKVV